MILRYYDITKGKGKGMKQMNMKGYWLVVLGLMMCGRMVAQMPSMAFRSVGVMAGSGSVYVSNPQLNADGTAEYPSVVDRGESIVDRGVSGARRIGPPTPEGPPTPIGDEVWPMMVMAVGYLLVKHVRRKDVRSKK